MAVSPAPDNLFSPGDHRNEVLFSENLIEQGSEMVDFVVVDADEEDPVPFQEFVGQHEPRKDHGKPVVVPVDRLAFPA